MDQLDQRGRWISSLLLPGPPNPSNTRLLDRVEPRTFKGPAPGVRRYENDDSYESTSTHGAPGATALDPHLFCWATPEAKCSRGCRAEPQLLCRAEAELKAMGVGSGTSSTQVDFVSSLAFIALCLPLILTVSRSYTTFPFIAALSLFLAIPSSSLRASTLPSHNLTTKRTFGTGIGGFDHLGQIFITCTTIACGRGRYATEFLEKLREHRTTGCGRATRSPLESANHARCPSFFEIIVPRNHCEALTRNADTRD